MIESRQLRRHMAIEALRDPEKQNGPDQFQPD
jgi:hypothetical protein